jgi:hypothetical protein
MLVSVLHRTLVLGDPEDLTQESFSIGMLMLQHMSLLSNR